MCKGLLRGLVYTTLLSVLLFSELLSAQEVRYFYDELGRLIAVVDPAGTVAVYEYDAVGNLLRITRTTAPAPPTLTSVTPAEAPAGTAVTVTLTGTGLALTTGVKAANPEIGVQRLATTDTTVTVRLTLPNPTTFGPTPLTVTTLGGSATIPFTVLQPPVLLTRLTPNAGVPRDVITLEGSGFGTKPGSNTVTFTGPNSSRLPAVVPTESFTHLTAIVPPGTVTGPVTVAVGGQTSNGLFFRTGNLVIVATAGVGTPADPTLASANTGQLLTIRGSGFTAGTQVTFPTRSDAGQAGTRGLTPSSVSLDGTRLTVVVPPDAATGPVSIAGLGSETLQIVPTVTGASGTFAPGVSLTLSGSGFIEAGSTITFGSVAVVDTDPAGGPEVTITNARLTVTVPLGAGPQVTVSTAGGTSNARILGPTAFTGITAVAVQGTPANTTQPSANVRQTIAVTGTNILPSSTVVFPTRDDVGGAGTQAVQVSTVSPDGTSATVGVDLQTATGPVRLFGAPESRLLQIVPTLTGVSGTFTPGASVTLAGFGFIEGGTTIMFGTVAVTDTDPVSGPDVTLENTLLTVTVPAGAGNTLTVTTAGGTSPPFTVPLQAVETEPNNTPATANSLALGGTVSGVINPTGDVDVYTVTAPAGTTVRARIEAASLFPASSLNARLTLLGPDGVTVLARNDADPFGFTFDPTLVFALPSAGPVFLRVESETGQGGPGFFYTLTLESITPTTPEIEPNDTVAQATPVSLSRIAPDFDRGALSGTIGAPGEGDLFRVPVTPGFVAQVSIYAASQGSPLRPRVTLLDSDGTTVLARSASELMGADERFVVFPPSGTFFLRVEDVNGQGGPGFFYTIIVEAFPVF